jgi:hydrogenase-4 component F
MSDWLHHAPTLMLATPAVAAALLALLPARRAAAVVNVLATAMALAGAAGVAIQRPQPNPWFALDGFSVYLVLLTGFVGFTSSIYSAFYISGETRRLGLSDGQVRLYHALYQVLLFGLFLALMAANIGLLWVAVEIATLATVVMVGLYRTHQALEAAWKYFILGSVGIALALFGTIVFYVGAQAAMGAGLEAMAWPSLLARAADFDPALLNLAFVLVLLGYGTKVGLVPLHAWLPDAHAEGPTPVSAVLSGLLLNVALYAVLRFKMLLAANPGALAPGPLMMILGLVSVLFAALMLYRRRDAKRFFAYSSIEHMGIITFAFGLGGPLASVAGLLHMALHSLAKSAVFFAVGQVAQIKGTQKLAEIRGLTQSHPALGWGLVLGVVAIAGLPPFGIFSAEFLLVSSSLAREPIAVTVLVIGLLVALGALVLRLQRAAFGQGQEGAGPPWPAYLPMYAHLALVLVASLYVPDYLVGWFEDVALRLDGH